MFSARTNQSGKLKAIIEVLFSNSQDVVLSISKHGITSEISTVNNATICAKLPASGFDEYIYTYEEPMYIGLGAHVNTFFKSLKNKTAVTLCITEPYLLTVLVTGADCSITYSASFMSAQNTCPDSTTSHEGEKSYSVATSTFTAMCKSFERAQIVNVSCCEGQLTFSSELTGISSKSMTFGVRDTVNTLSHRTFFQQYKPDTLRRISKLSSFSDKPLMLIVTENSALVICAESQLGTIKVVVHSGSSD